MTDVNVLATHDVISGSKHVLLAAVMTELVSLFTATGLFSNMPELVNKSLNSHEGNEVNLRFRKHLYHVTYYVTA